MHSSIIHVYIFSPLTYRVAMAQEILLRVGCSCVISWSVVVDHLFLQYISLSFTFHQYVIIFTHIDDYSYYMIINTHRIHGAGIYANIGGILMGSMLPYIAAPWILWNIMAGWWFGTFFIFPYIGNNHPN